jgi:hypothetical protein
MFRAGSPEWVQACGLWRYEFLIYRTINISPPGMFLHARGSSLRLTINDFRPSSLRRRISFRRRFILAHRHRFKNLVMCTVCDHLVRKRRVLWGEVIL